MDKKLENTKLLPKSFKNRQFTPHIYVWDGQAVSIYDFSKDTDAEAPEDLAAKIKELKQKLVQSETMVTTLNENIKKLFEDNISKETKIQNLSNENIFQFTQIDQIEDLKKDNENLRGDNE